MVTTDCWHSAHFGKGTLLLQYSVPAIPYWWQSLLLHPPSVKA